MKGPRFYRAKIFAAILIAVVVGGATAALFAQEDKTPPQLMSFAFTPEVVDVTGSPQDVTVTARIVDNTGGSGIYYGCAYFQSPSHNFSAEGCFNRTSGDQFDGIYSATAHVPQYVEQGVWQAYAFVYDEANNETFYGPDALTAHSWPSQLEVTYNQPPVAKVGAPISLIVNEVGQFNGSGSSDTDGTVASYNWDFGDGTTAEGVSVSHAYLNSGTFTATLTVIDNQGGTGTDTATVIVKDVSNAITSLTDMVSTYNLKQGITNSLDSKIQNIIAAFSAANAGDRQDVKNKLQAFINSVEAQRGKELTNAQADALESLAGRILGVL
jgi:PKD repeat protein